MDRQESADRIEEIREEITTLVGEARNICLDQALVISNLDAYVFEQILEHVDNSNPHNQSLRTIIEELGMSKKGIDVGDEVAFDGKECLDSGIVTEIVDGLVSILVSGEDEQTIKLDLDDVEKIE